jgi:hypothetical protein
MADKKIRLLVQAEVKKAVKALNKIEKEQKDIKKQNDGLKKSFKAIGGAIAAAFSVQVVAQFLGESIKLGSQMISLEKAFKNLGKGVGFNEKSLQKFRKATDGTVSDVELMIQANNAMLLGIVENDDQFADLIDNAQRLAKAVGQDAKFGIESLTTGIGRQSKLMLDNLGIILDTNLAYERYAEKIGKSTSELDENERKQAFIQAAMESTREKVDQLGEETLDANDATNKLSAAFENLKGTIGKEFQGEVVATTGFLTNLLNVYSFFIKNVGIGSLATGQAAETMIRKAQEAREEANRLPELQFRTVDESVFTQGLENQLSTYEAHLEAMNNLDNNRFEFRMGTIKNEFFEMEALRKSNAIAIKERIKLERQAHMEKIQNNLQMALLSGQSAKDAVRATIQAEMVEAQGKLISSIMDLPFPLNLAIAAGAGAMIDKVFSKLPSFATGGSFVTKGRTTLPIGSGVVVGDNASGMERVDVTPLPAPNTNEGNITININAPVVDEYVVDSIIPAIERARKLNL